MDCNNKIILPCINIINQITGPITATFKVNKTLMSFNSTLSVNGSNYFFIAQNLPLFDPNQIVTKSIILNNKSYKWIYRNISSHANMQTITCDYNINISEIIGKSEGGYKRLIIPIKGIEIQTLPFFLQLSKGSSDIRSNCVYIDLEINNQHFHVIKNDEYFIIDSTKKVNHDKFSFCCKCILLSFGFFTGTFISENEYYFSSKTKDFIKPCLYRFREESSSKMIYQKMLLGSVGCLYKTSTEFKKHQNEYSYITIEIFNKLINLCYNEANIFDSLYKLKESINLSLDVQPACYCVILEQLCEFYIKNNNVVIAHIITDPVLENNVVKALKKTLKGLKNSTNQKELNKIENKYIDNIKSTPNFNKMTKCFELLNISLEKDELEALVNRNFILHGNLHVEVNDFNIKYKQRKIKGLINVLAIDLLLFSLIYKFLLKYLGYEYYFLNIKALNCDIFKTKRNTPKTIKF